MQQRYWPIWWARSWQDKWRRLCLTNVRSEKTVDRVSSWIPQRANVKLLIVPTIVVSSLQIEQMKLPERLLDFNIRKMVSIDEMEFGFVSLRGTNNAIVIVCQPQEKYMAGNKLLYFPFVDLEKAFDRVPRKVLCWDLRCLSVDELPVCVI